MNCRSYEDHWHDWLDARGAEPEGLVRALEEHESACAACREQGRGYRALRRAIGGMVPAPAAPEGFAARFAPGGDLAGEVARPAILPARPRPGGRIRIWPAAAAALVAALIGVRGGRVDRKGPEVAAARRPLSAALAEATSASWALARATSAPAARVGRDAIGEAAELDLPTLAIVGPEAAAVPGPPRAAVDAFPAGVRPLSGSARHAFGFLLAPVLNAEGRGSVESISGQRKG